ncbi:MAG: LptF/LptG family permease [Bacteroidales bacterium]|nr:LptF/LptG family permease [Bacteroidales bacterium]
MKKLDLHILRSFIGPLLLTFSIAVFVLLMQFVWKYIDDMVGKGLSVGVIAELLFYASATFVPMALPIAVLFASIMTMGNFGEKYELIAMKAGGISLRRAMMPMALVVTLLTGVAFYFANNVLPAATLRYRMTLYDVTRKKPAVNIRPSEYYSEIEGYVIRINEKDPETGMLKDIIIYDHTKQPGQSSLIVADGGTMQTSADGQYLLFTLYNGHSYTEEMDGENRESRPFTSVDFKEQVLTFDLSSFAFDKSDKESFRSNCQMMNVRQLDSTTRQIKKDTKKKYEDFTASTISKMSLYQHYKQLKEKEGKPVAKASPFDYNKSIAELGKLERSKVRNRARAIGDQIASDYKVYSQVMKSDSEYLARHYVVWYRKYTFSIACIVLFLVGAPFGSIVRKGGLGMPLVASVLFFVLYYVIDMIDEKSVRGGAMDEWGMWVATLVFIPIGIFLTVYATTDSSPSNLRWYIKLREKLSRRRKKTTDKSDKA